MKRKIIPRNFYTILSSLSNFEKSMNEELMDWFAQVQNAALEIISNPASITSR